MIDIKFRSKLSRVINPGTITEEEEADLNEILFLCREKLSTVNEKLITKSFLVCLVAHSGHYRKSGRAYYSYCLDVAKTVLNEIHLDDVSVAVSLMTEVIDRDELFSLQNLKVEFGSTMATILDGLQIIRTFEIHRYPQENHLENFRKILLSLSTDVRIILIKIAIRLNNMRTLEYLPSDRQRLISEETMEVYVPFSNRFGLRNIKWELEDLSFKFTNRESYDNIKSRLKSKRKEREKYVSVFTAPVIKKITKDAFLKKHKVKVEIKGRAKHIYSIYNKMHLREKPLEELYDLVAMRLILDTNDPMMCFYVYGLVASIYPPVPETFKDYISAPKKNGYQSIHTALLGQDNKAVEVQIRTREMHIQSEQGMAAHFNYKRGPLPASSVFDDMNVQSWLESIKDIVENKENLPTRQLLESVKSNLFMEQIHVFTPKNELLSFPKEATVIDFAYEIHTDIGSKIVGAKINGQQVGISHKLKSGDLVEILISNNQSPTKDWLNLVTTPKAKSSINKHLKAVKKIKLEEGQTLWEDALKENKLYIKRRDFKSLLKSLKYTESENFFLSLQDGSLNLHKAIDFMKYKLRYGDEYDNQKYSNFDPTGPKIAGVITNFIITGQNRKDIMPSILQQILTFNGILINSASYNIFGAKFEANIKMEVSTKVEINTLTDELYSIEGVNFISKIDVAEKL